MRYDLNSSEIRYIKETYNELEKMLENHILPDVYPDNVLENHCNITMLSEMGYISIRENLIRLSSFPCIDKEFIKELAKPLKDKKVLEIMAGRGVISKGLKDNDIDVICTTLKHGEYSTLVSDNPWYEDIEYISAIEAIDKYGKDIDYVIMSWAPYNTSDAYEALLELRKVNPNCILICIGEPGGGCTADDKFFEEAVELYDPKFNKAYNALKQWWGIHDILTLYK